MPTIQTTIETSSTTADLLSAIRAGKIKKSPDREFLLDEYGAVVANRIAAKGQADYYADAKQEFPPGARQSCLVFDHHIGPLDVIICVCVDWGDQILEV